MAGERAARVMAVPPRITAAYLGHARPRAAEVIAGRLDAGRPGAGRPGAGRLVVVIPMLLTEAFHSSVDLPAVLRGARAGLPAAAGTGPPCPELRYGSPLGPHPALLRGLERRLAEAGFAVTPPATRDTAVVLAAAGSARPDANAVIADLAAAWQAHRGWQAVVPAYAAAASPAPAEAVRALLRGGARRVVVASYLLAAGRFADQVRHTSLAAGAAAVSAPLGAAPEVADVLLERYVQALADTCPGQ